MAEGDWVKSHQGGTSSVYDRNGRLLHTGDQKSTADFLKRNNIKQDQPKK